MCFMITIVTTRVVFLCLNDLLSCNRAVYNSAASNHNFLVFQTTTIFKSQCICSNSTIYLNPVVQQCGLRLAGRFSDALARGRSHSCGPLVGGLRGPGVWQSAAGLPREPWLCPTLPGEPGLPTWWLQEQFPREQECKAQDLL